MGSLYLDLQSTSLFLLYSQILFQILISGLIGILKHRLFLMVILILFSLNLLTNTEFLRGFFLLQKYSIRSCIVVLSLTLIPQKDCSFLGTWPCFLAQTETNTNTVCSNLWNAITCLQRWNADKQIPPNSTQFR